MCSHTAVGANWWKSIYGTGLSPAAVRSRLLRLRSLWDEIRQQAEEREGKLNDVLDLAGKFWADMAALLSTLKDSQDIVKELEDPGVDPSLIKQQVEAAEVWEICVWTLITWVNENKSTVKTHVSVFLLFSNYLSVCPIYPI